MGKSNPGFNNLTVLIKGGGEVGSAVAHRLYQSGFRVCITEAPYPLAVHRGTTFCEAVYDGEKEVESVRARLIDSPQQITDTWASGEVPVIVDPKTHTKDSLHPDILIDATMAKRNVETGIDDASLVIGLGPGCTAGKDVNVVIETNHSEDLGKIILEGEAEKDTGVPMDVGGFTFERAIHTPVSGRFHSPKEIGDIVAAGETVAFVGSEAVTAEIGGIIRAMLRGGVEVGKGVKIVEVDPVGGKDVCYSIRPKMSTIAGGVLRAIKMHYGIG
ncbi:MAG: selenium-dependent molybdenum cofactor biosynthesis protein YqeB [Chloroflexota bacterium]